MSNILKETNIRLNEQIDSKEQAVREVGGILFEEGYVQEEYIDTMMEREEITSTYMGNYVAIPHGTEDAKKSVKETGIAIITAPDGVDFGNGNIVKLIIGIAGKGNEHLDILSKIAIVCSEEENINRILEASTKSEVIDIFSEEVE
ncbi:PTS sugar transporter subunit IIA [Salimicrobium album]|uniref:Mannitol-specific phosphotransferase enzyme IIA component n=1 Tax=Salimicrobium album TaxID=50717 RepID=A0A1H3FXR7_9BACI|nr:PTS sugar transporter subunit IIA [Salimicrobium album]SDX95635.1 PTS system D-mannitol-specific IIA component, Fru family (TC 4.A.2.1.2) [Salimicrobium album]